MESTGNVVQCWHIFLHLSNIENLCRCFDVVPLFSREESQPCSPEVSDHFFKLWSPRKITKVTRCQATKNGNLTIYGRDFLVMVISNNGIYLTEHKMLIFVDTILKSSSWNVCSRCWDKFWFFSLMHIILSFFTPWKHQFTAIKHCASLDIFLDIFYLMINVQGIVRCTKWHYTASKLLTQRCIDLTNARYLSSILFSVWRNNFKIYTLSFSWFM